MFIFASILSAKGSDPIKSWVGTLLCTLAEEKSSVLPQQELRSIKLNRNWRAKQWKQVELQL